MKNAKCIQSSVINEEYWQISLFIWNNGASTKFFSFRSFSNFAPYFCYFAFYLCCELNYLIKKVYYGKLAAICWELIKIIQVIQVIGWIWIIKFVFFYEWREYIFLPQTCFIHISFHWIGEGSSRKMLFYVKGLKCSEYFVQNGVESLW